MTLLSNKPKLLRGSFREYQGPLGIEFQFNPEEITRNRSLSFKAPGEAGTIDSGGKGDVAQTRGNGDTLREFHQQFKDLNTLRENQIVTVHEETLDFDIRLNAKDLLAKSQSGSQFFGIGPQISALEILVHRKGDFAIESVGDGKGFTFTEKEPPPMVLFVWGRYRVLPVNINSINIKETEYTPNLDPVEAVVSVNMTVIEGPNTSYSVTHAIKKAEAIIPVFEMAIPGE